MTKNSTPTIHIYKEYLHIINIGNRTCLIIGNENSTNNHDNNSSVMPHELEHITYLVSVPPIVHILLIKAYTDYTLRYYYLLCKCLNYF